MGLPAGQPEREPVDRKRSLESIPVLNPGVRLDPQPDNRLLVTVPVVPKRRGWLRFMHPKVLERKVRLDELGAFVIRQIDGQRPVQAIVDAFVKRYGTTRREAELSTAEFLKSLAQRNVISIGVR
jgi:hypothetical protein